MKEPGPERGAVVVAGATGYIGRHVAGELARRGYPVLALVRPGRGVGDPFLAGCTRVETEVTDPARLGRDLAGRRASAIVSCLASRSGVRRDAERIDRDANRSLLHLAPALGAERFLLLSAICVQRPRLAFQRAKLEFEAQLQSSPLAWTIVRPTAFFKSLAGQVERVRRGKPFLVFGDGRRTACKPIGERDLADFMVDCLERPDCRNRIFPVGGPGPALTPRRQGELLHAALGKTPVFRSVPPGLLLWAARTLGAVGRLVPSCADKAELARIGHYYATESMLLWDQARGGYDADATPETGTETLEDFYLRVADEGLEGQDLGAHRMFDRARPSDNAGTEKNRGA